MKLARKIVRVAEDKYGNARYGGADVIVADASEWESIIAARLEPIREALRELIEDASDMRDLCEEEWGTCSKDEDPDILKAKAVLALFEKEE